VTKLLKKQSEALNFDKIEIWKAKSRNFCECSWLWEQKYISFENL